MSASNSHESNSHESNSLDQSNSHETNQTSPQRPVTIQIQTPQSVCYTFEGYLEKDYADELLEHCSRLTLIDNLPIKIYGRVCYQKRAVGFYSDSSSGFKYSGQLLQSQPLPDFLRIILEDVNKSLETDFNGILVNLYKDGQDSIGFHSDSEQDLAKGGTVASISIGASRTFRIRSKSNAIPEKAISTSHGQLLVMQGNFQKEFTHGIPAESGVSNPRFSLTLRRHLA